MAQYLEAPCKTFVASAAIARYLRVKLTAGQLAVAGVGASDEPSEIGTIEEASFAAGDVRPVRMRSAEGTCKMVAAGVIAVGVIFYGAASGQIGTTSSGNVLGIALEAAAAAGDVIEVLRY